mmetsp:Transcript_57648/g.187292  ORF Transcript_57648/g.187292 Transcript_57648/m.187292 type:complete len:545 (+) Transcript_57648:174-1808(+)
MGCGTSSQSAHAPVQVWVASQADSAVDKAPATATRVPDTVNRRIVQHVRELYALEEQVGAGVSGYVAKAVNHDTGATCAIKCMSSEFVTEHQMHLEADILAMVEHPNIVRLLECLEDPTRTFLVMELCEGGELLDKVQWTDGLREAEVAILMRQVFDAMQHMHSRFVCHRDIKAENFMFVSKGPIDQTPLKAIDFGLACMFQPGVPMRRKVGSTFYMSPEVLQESYHESCDLWSCGNIMYLLCTGTLPFADKTESKTCKKIKKGKFAGLPRRVSSEARDIVTGLLNMRPRDRLTAAQSLTHPWMRKMAPAVPLAAAAPSRVPAQAQGRTDIMRPAQAYQASGCMTLSGDLEVVALPDLEDERRAFEVERPRTRNENLWNLRMVADSEPHPDVDSLPGAARGKQAPWPSSWGGELTPSSGGGGGGGGSGIAGRGTPIANKARTSGKDVFMTPGSSRTQSTASVPTVTTALSPEGVSPEGATVYQFCRQGWDVEAPRAFLQPSSISKLAAAGAELGGDLEEEFLPEGLGEMPPLSARPTSAVNFLN